MTGNAKRLFETASKDAQLREKLTIVPRAEAVLAIAKENGIELTEEDRKRTPEGFWVLRPYYGLLLRVCGHLGHHGRKLH